MTLAQFLAVLTSPNVQVTLVDLESSNEIAVFKAAGFASLDDTIEAKEVKQWQILSATSIKVVLADA